MKLLDFFPKNVFAVRDSEVSNMLQSKEYKGKLNLCICNNIDECLASVSDGHAIAVDKASDIAHVELFLDMIDAQVFYYVMDNENFSTLHISESNVSVDDFATMDIKASVLEAAREMRQNQVGQAPLAITDAFIREYWLWQRGERSVNEILSSENDFTFETRAQFYSIAKRYESTRRYFAYLQEHAEELVLLKKRGSVRTEEIMSIISAHADEKLTNDIIDDVCQIWNPEKRIWYVDFWRVMQAISTTRAFAALQDCEIKKSIVFALQYLKINPKLIIGLENERHVTFDYDNPDGLVEALKAKEARLANYAELATVVQNSKKK